RNGASWGGNPSHDWRGAALRGATAVLSVNPDLLIMVEGPNYATDLRGAYSQPLRLPVANRLVYSAHDYPWDHPQNISPSALHSALGERWGFLLQQGMPYTAPVWVGEFGTCHTSDSCVDDSSGQGLWCRGFRKYLAEGDIDWCYW